MSPSHSQTLIFRGELSKPEFKMEVYYFLTAGESQLTHKEEGKV